MKIPVFGRLWYAGKAQGGRAHKLRKLEVEAVLHLLASFEMGPKRNGIVPTRIPKRGRSEHRSDAYAAYGIDGAMPSLRLCRMPDSKA